jgi:zinc protease
MKTRILVICLFAAVSFILMISCSREQKEHVVEYRVPSDPTISFRIWFKTGSQNDPAGYEGLAAFTASMLTDASTTKNSYEKILEKLYPMAAGYNVSVDKEMTVISGRVHKDHVNAYMELFTDAILHPAFNEDDFNRIKQNTLNYLQRTLRYSNDEAFGKQTLYGMVYENTRYAHPEAGLINSVESITLEHVIQFYRMWFTRENMVIGIGGGYNRRILDQLDELLSELLPNVAPKASKPALKNIDGLHVKLVEKQTRSTAISIGFPIDVRRGDDDFYALWIANSWFGEHRNQMSHLFQVIREARGMNYGNYSYIEAFPNAWARSFPPPNASRRQQMFEIWIRPVQNAHAHFALRAAIRELDKLIESGMTEENFELAKQFLRKYHLHYAPTTSTRLGYKLDDVFYGIDDHLASLPKQLDEITLEEVNSAIRKHLQTENMAIAMVTDNGRAMQRALTGNTPSPITYATQQSVLLLEEDKEIQAYHLDIKPENVTIISADDMFIR